MDIFSFLEEEVIITRYGIMSWMEFRADLIFRSGLGNNFTEN
jgi:hypothetical protein